MSQRLLGFLLVSFGGIILTIGDLIIKKWVNGGSYVSYIFGMIVYVIGLNFMAQSFKFKNIAIASMVFVLINIITLLIVSWVYFKQTLSPLQLFGMSLGIVSVTILQIT